MTQKFFLITAKGKYLVTGEPGNWKVTVDNRAYPVSGIALPERGEHLESVQLRSHKDFKEYFYLYYMETEEHISRINSPIKGTIGTA